MPGPYKGSCLCGVITYEINRFQPRTGHCHCTMCRKFHGAAYATYGEALSSDFRWISGKNSLKVYTADNGTTRSFCEHCGSSLTFTSASVVDDIVEISLGTLDEDSPVQADAHLFCESKANWTHIDDDLLHFQHDRSSGELV